MQGPPQSLSDLLPWLEALLEDERQAMALRHKVMLARLCGQMACDKANPMPPAHPARAAAPSAVEPIEMEALGCGQANPKPPAHPSTAAAPSAAELIKMESLECEEHAAAQVKEALPIELPTTLEEDNELPIATLEENKTFSRAISPCSSASLAKRKSSLEETLASNESTPVKILDAYGLVTSHQFEVFFAVAILMNAVVMAIESMYDGIDMGRRIGFPGHDKSAKDAWPGALEFFEVTETVFGVVFFLEVLLKLFGLKAKFVQCAWNLFDTFLVVVWLVDTLMQRLPVEPSTLRILRLARLMRIVRILRTMAYFDSLIVMTTALQGSMSALLWVGVLLFLMQMLFALVLGQLLTMYLGSAAPTLESSRVIFEYFGTFPRATLSMFELTLGNFAPVARILQEDVSGWTVLFSLFHKVTFGFACVGVVNGVFMQETFKVAQSDDGMMLRAVQKQKRMHATKMQNLFEIADDSCDGSVSFEEWKKVLENENAQNWFAGMGLSVSDAGLLFALLETSGDAKLSAEELATGVARLQGPAKSLDVAKMLQEQEALAKQLQPAHVANLVVELLEQRLRDQQLVPKQASARSMEPGPGEELNCQSIQPVLGI